MRIEKERNIICPFNSLTVINKNGQEIITYDNILFSGIHCSKHTVSVREKCKYLIEVIEYGKEVECKLEYNEKLKKIKEILK